MTSYSKWDQILKEHDDSDDENASEIDNIRKQQEAKEQRMVAQHQRCIQDTMQRMSRSNDYQFIRSIIDMKAAQHVCTTSEKQLKPIQIWQLVPNQIHYGYKLMAKIISPPDKLLSVRCVIKDVRPHAHGQHVIYLSVYNLVPFQVSLSQMNSMQVLRQGTTILIKEPYAKIDKSNQMSLRIDNPFYNLAIIQPSVLTHGLQSESIDSLKARGNECFQRRQYWNAVTCYNQALATQSTDIEVKTKLLSNRCLCFLKLNEAHLALADALSAFQLNAQSLKVRYRYLCCLNAIHGNSANRQKAISMIDALLKSKPLSKQQKHANQNLKIFVDLRTEIDRRCKEMLGDYSKSYALMAHETKWRLVEDFVANICLKTIDAIKGRGMIATKDIQCGELILAEKAFSFGCYNSNGDAQQIYVQSFNAECKTAYSGRNQQLILDTLKKCFACDYNDYRDGHFRNESRVNSVQSALNKWKVMQLYDGSSDCALNPNPISMFTDDRFLCDSLQKQKQLDTISKQAISARMVNDIILHNAFETLMRPEHILEFLEEDSNQFDVLKNERFCGSGLWILGSLFNHSDQANAERFVFYKMMFIKASREVKKGQEINISYVDKSLSAASKQTDLKRWNIPT